MILIRMCMPHPSSEPSPAGTLPDTLTHVLPALLPARVCTMKKLWGDSIQSTLNKTVNAMSANVNAVSANVKASLGAATTGGGAGGAGPEAASSSSGGAPAAVAGGEKQYLR